MTNELESKRLSDDELETVAGGVTPPTIDPSMLASLMHATVSSAVAGGGAYTVDTPTPVHTDTGTPTITGQTQITVSGSTLFGPEVHVSSAPVELGTATLSGDLGQSLNLSLPGSITEQSPTIQVMHFDNTQGNWTPIKPAVSGVQEGGGPNLGGALTTAFKS